VRTLGASLLVLTLASFATSALACSGAGDDAVTGDDQNQTAALSCAPAPACSAAPFAAPPHRDWRHPIKSRIDSAVGDPNHRGRDLFVNPGAPQTVIGKMAYGVMDKDLEDEEVDVYVQRDCGDSWELLGTTLTTGENGPHPAVEGVDDSQGRVYFEIPESRRLGPGRHRIRLVVAGDGSSTDLFLDVVAPKTPIFISDVDGTLTSSENVEFLKLLEGELPETHPGAPEALRALAAKGYRPIYVTARPEWLVQRTRDFLEKHGFPPGIVHTSTSITGAGFGASAATFKSGELAMLAEKGLVPAFGFGNMPSDSDAYGGANIQPPDHRIFYQISGTFTGRRIESYTELVPGFEALPRACH
jgi:LNS2-like protein (lipin/Ned1/Smp2)